MHQKSATNWSGNCWMCKMCIDVVYTNVGNQKFTSKKTLWKKIDHKIRDRES